MDRIRLVFNGSGQALLRKGMVVNAEDADMG
jgi:hypothetical protein